MKKVVQPTTAIGGSASDKVGDVFVHHHPSMKPGRILRFTELMHPKKSLEEEREVARERRRQRKKEKRRKAKREKQREGWKEKTTTPGKKRTTQKRKRKREITVWRVIPTTRIYMDFITEARSFYQKSIKC